MGSSLLGPHLPAPPVASAKGAVVLHYAIEPGTPGTDDMTRPDGDA